MRNLSVNFRKFYGGMKTFFGRGGAKKTVQNAAPKYQGPTITQMAERMPLALPAPSAEAIAARQPRVNIGKALGRNLDELRMSQVVTRDGTHVRYYRGAESDRILLKTADHGTLHQEWIYGNAPEQLTYVKSTGGGDRYIMKRDGNFIQIEKRSTQYKDGINQTTSTNDLYFSDGAGGGFHRQDVKGFNGQQSSNLEIRGNATLYQGREWESVEPYHIKNAGVEYRGGRDEAEKLLCDIYKKDYQAAETLAGHIDDVRKTARAKFVSDFDEALFSAYKS